MTFQQLKYIIEISKSRSITAAAQNLFISQPSLSKSVKELETELGITILKRTRHGISFTSSGMEFLSYAYRIAEQIEGMQSYFRQDETNERKINLSISAQHYMFPTDALVQFIQKAEKYHSYTVTMQEGRTTQVIHDVLVQQSQIGIIYVSKATEKFMHRLFQHKGLEFIPFRQYPPYVYLRAQHPLASRKQINVRELEPYPYVRYGQGQDPYLFF
ncbi:LysR family transcriptional regulator [Megasphaera paucivorans]|uniref:LysR substrate binding domain-containing protein n=1 Tax=Megasphaera paucivorans TaxID=349095 RepID=A0A1H0AUB7_9FIRM|nr:LysR family transcriptional regulator [Megasphaera paucivorans]SDN37037.1 LysR substrate binding domain-containing protein [Megasphaera paucivorans]